MPTKTNGNDKPKSDRRRAARKGTHARPRRSSNVAHPTRAMLASLRSENQSLRATVRKLKKELADQRRLSQPPPSQLYHANSAGHARPEQRHNCQRLGDHSLKLFVASHRLHSTLNWETLLSTVQEIVSDLIGSQESAIFAVDGETSSLQLLASSAIDASSFRKIPLGTGLIGHVALSGDPYFNDGRSTTRPLPEESNLTAAIPLYADGKVFGVIAIFRLLEQKNALEPFDYELFDYLSNHAGMALHWAKLGLPPGHTGDAHLRTI